MPTETPEKGNESMVVGRSSEKKVRSDGSKKDEQDLFP
jgi:hypothetical protein